MAEQGSAQPKRAMSEAELDELQARIDSLRSRLLKPAATTSMAHHREVPEPLFVLKRRRSWTWAPVGMTAAVVALAEVAALAVTGHGVVNVAPFLVLAWWPWTNETGELRVHAKGIELPSTGGIVLPWTDMERVERRRWNKVPVLHFDAIVGTTAKIFGDRREVVIRLTPFMTDWTAGPFADLLRVERPQLLPD